MTIAYVSDAIYPYHIGGKEKRLYELSTRLAKLGHDVHIYTMHWWPTLEKQRMEEGVQLHAISKLHPMYTGDRRSIKEGVLFGLACFRLMRVQFDVIDVDHMPFFPIYSSWLVCKLRGKKLYGTWHEALTREDWTAYMGRAGIIASVIERLSIRLPYHITAASQNTKDALGTVHGRTHRISLVTPGIDAKLLQRIVPADITCDVLYIGRFVKDKNIDTLIRAVAQLATSMPEIRCLIIGHGIEEPKLQALRKKLGLQKNVAIRKPLHEDKEVYSYMKAAKVFCSPSAREGFGMVVLESIGCGTPVVTTNAPANHSRHLVAEGISGTIVAPKYSDLAQAIQQWLSIPKQTTIAQSVASYDWTKQVQKQAEVYAQ